MALDIEPKRLSDAKTVLYIFRVRVVKAIHRQVVSSSLVCILRGEK